MTTKLIDLRGIRERFPRSKAWIFQEIAAGRFPKPLPLRTNKNLWDESEIEKYLAGFLANAKAAGERHKHIPVRGEKARKAFAERRAQAAA